MGGAEPWPESLAELVDARSQGRLAIGSDELVGRYLVAAKDLPAREPALTEEALFWGSDEARALRTACTKRDAEEMMEAWERPEEGGGNPLAHFDLFSSFALAKTEVAVGGFRRGPPAARAAAAAAAAQRVQRLAAWFCRPAERWVDREAQAEKLATIHGVLKPGVRGCVPLEELRLLDDVLSRNAEELTGALAIFGGDGRGAPFLGRRRFQGIFPCKDLIQHSCAPNCLTVAGPDQSESGEEKLVLHVVPLRKIAAGERLTWCYLPYWKWLWPTQLRREALRESWDFLCQCERCAGEQGEAVMAFRCPSCGSGNLRPERPCAAAPSRPAAAGGAQGCGAGCGGAGQAAALEEVQALRCECGLRLARGAAEGEYAGYMERCLAEEARIMALPWKGVLGRDQPEKAELCSGAGLLAETHWLIVDHASHLLENAPGILKELGLASPGSKAPAVEAALARFAEAAETLAEACIRLHGDDLAPALPELVVSKALCTGASFDFEAAYAAQLRVFGSLRGARSALAAAERLRDSRRGFLASCLQLQPAAADRLRLQLLPEGPAAGQVPEALEEERSRIRRWLGRGAAPAAAGDGPAGLGPWALRRMWLCPDFGEDEPPAEPEEAARPSRKRPAAGATPRAKKAARKRPAACAPEAAARRRPAAGGRRFAAAAARSLRRRPAADRGERRGAAGSA